MKFLNPKIEEDIANKKLIALHLGSGTDNHKDMYNLDLIECDGVDITANLNEPLELLPDNSVSYVYSNQTLEHIEELFDLFGELHRVCADGSILEMQVPHFANPYYYSDPTHVRFFGLYSMHYFTDQKYQWGRKVPSYYGETKFILSDAQYVFYRDTVFDHVVGRPISYLVNCSRLTQRIYERRFCWLFSPSSIKFTLTISKHS
jgi:hypothetical protein